LPCLLTQATFVFIMGLFQRMLVLVLACVAAGEEQCMGASCPSMKAQSMLQRNRVATKKKSMGLDSHNSTSPGNAELKNSSDSEVASSLAYAKTEVMVKTESCAKKVTDLELVSDTVQVVDGIDVELVVKVIGHGAQTYHKITVMWIPGAAGSLTPSLRLPYDNGVPIAWCTLLANSTSTSLAELAKKEGHDAVKRYHKMLGYKGGWNASTNPDKLLQVKSASCDGSSSLPATYDLRNHQVHAPCFTAEAVENQGGCGSCWAFAAAHAMTARLCMQDQADIINNPDGQGRRFVSVQAVLSCGSGAGCDGGWMSSAFDEWQRGGAPLARDYEYYPEYGGQPWHAMGYGCQWGDYVKPYKVTNVYSPHYNVQSMMEELWCNGPFTVAFTVYNNFFSYSSGVYKDIGDGTMAGGHAVTLVGWGNEDGSDFWELMNSWGEYWGDGGFFKMLRGTDFCQVESWGLSAATAAKTEGSWMLEDWGMCEFKDGDSDATKTRDLKCVDNTDVNSLIAESSCPDHWGWPDKNLWPNVQAGVPAEVAAKGVCGDDDHITCSDAFCYGKGTGTDVDGTCTCTCDAEYAGDRCDNCATGYEGFPECREKCTRDADCSGHGGASGVKWLNEFGGQLDSCSCMCDEGWNGPTCSNNCGSACTTTTTTLACTDGDVMLANSIGNIVSSASEYAFPWVFWSGDWYPICGHYFWDSTINSDIICEMLGMGPESYISKVSTSFNFDAMPVGNCNAGESLTSCTNGGNGWGDFSHNSGWCTAGNNIGVQIKCGGTSPVIAASCSVTTTTTTPCTGAHCSASGFIVEGPCSYDPHTGCATSGNYPSNYPSDENCVLKPDPIGVTLHIVDFATEAGWDFLTIQGTKISGDKQQAAAFEGVALTEDIIWAADYIYEAPGWKICAQQASTTTTTTTLHPCHDGSHGCDAHHGVCLEVPPPEPFTCANENGHCECTGQVKYGADTRWSDWKDVVFGIDCNNGVFGDPAHGTPKTCVCQPAAAAAQTQKYAYVGCYSDSPAGQYRPPDVPTTIEGVQQCRDACADKGYKYFGFECPHGDQVHCECATGTGHQNIDQQKCKEFNVNSGGHCSGPFEASGSIGEYVMGAGDIGSLYEVEATAPAPPPPATWKCECQSGFHCIAGCDNFTGHTCAPIWTTTTTTTLYQGFIVARGPCFVDADGTCVSSPDFPHAYGDNQECEIMAVGGVYKLDVKVFKTEQFDTLKVNNHEFSGELDDVQALQGMVLQSNITWQSDESVGKEGWRLCLEPAQ